VPAQVFRRGCSQRQLHDGCDDAADRAAPALSHHVGTLENELGAVLFERHAHGVKLTVESQRLLDRAASIQRQMDRPKDDVRNGRGQPLGPVSLCIVGAASHG